MTTPLTTIADALIEFILSLLRDPETAAEFEQDPEGTLNRAGLGDACVDDVRAVAPVIVDRPDVHPKPVPVGPVNPPSPPHPGPPSVEKEIWNISNNFSIENRVSNVDQSVNQNIWAEGDVNQIFDQEAVVNQGDNAATAGNDADADNSETDVTIGDVAIGNDDNDVEIVDSFDDESTETEVDLEADVEDSFNEENTDVAVDVSVVEDSYNNTYEGDSDSASVELSELPEDELVEQP